MTLLLLFQQGPKRVSQTLSETITIDESLSRQCAKIRTVSETNSISESLSRIKSAVRSISQTTVISEALSRVKQSIRSVSQTTTISEALSRVKTLIRTITETITIDEQISNVVTHNTTTQTYGNYIKFGPKKVNLFKYKRTVNLSIPIHGALASEYSNLLRGQLLYERKVNTKSRITVDESFRISSKITSNHITEVKSRLESAQSAIIEGLISRKFLKMNKATKLLGLMELYDD